MRFCVGLYTKNKVKLVQKKGIGKKIKGQQKRKQGLDLAVRK